MENLGSNPTIVNGDLLELSPMRLPHPILKPSQKDNLIMLQTPVQKNLKVSFLTPKRTPLKDHNLLQNTTGNAGHIPNHFVPETSSHVAMNTEMVKQPTMPILMKTPDSLKGFKSSLMTKEMPQRSSAKANYRKCDSKWESLRKLDENSHWRDRVEVITKLDHEEHTKCAQEVVYEIISRAVDLGESNVLISSAKERSATFESTGNLVAPSIKIQSVENSIPSTEIQSGENASKYTENILLKPRHDTFHVTSPHMKCDKLVISSGDVSLITKSVSRYSLTDSYSCKGLQLCEPGLVPSALKNGRSFSDSYDTPANKITSGSNVRHQSLDLDQIKFDFDPISTRCIENNLVGQSVKASPMESLNQSVFSPAAGVDSQPEFALRAVDSIFGDSDFVDSAKLIDQGHLDLDYLENKTSGTVSADLQKESLYVKFDPLLEGLENRQSVTLLGRKSDIIDFCGRITPIPEEANEDQLRPAEREPDLLCDSPPRVMQEDTVANHNQPAAKQGSPGSTSSASFTEDHSHEKPSDSGIIEVLKYTDADLQRALQKRKDKWMKEKSAFQERTRSIEEKLKQLKIAKRNLVERCEDHSSSLSKEKAEIEEHMAHHRGEQLMINTRAKELTDKMSTLFRKMESLQNVVADHKSNEKKLKDIAAQMQKKKIATEEKTKKLGQETADILKKAYSDKASVESNCTAQMKKLKLKMRAAELRAESLQTTLNMKHKEKGDLLQICDELVESNERRS